GRLAAGRHERGAASLLEACDDLVDLFLGRRRAHHDQKLRCAGCGHTRSVEARFRAQCGSAMATDTKLRVFSGIQPTGRKTLGNYSGGFRQYAETQERGDAFFCIVDLHSITVEYDPKALRDATLDLAAMLFATGIDAERSTVFCQSHVTAHAEAAWLLSSVTSYGQLGRMTQFKDKGDRQEFVSAGLFTYPVLMAGDIPLSPTRHPPLPPP